MNKKSDEDQRDIAVIKTHLGYIRDDIATVKKDVSEMKNAYVTAITFTEYKKTNDDLLKSFVTSDKFEPVKRVVYWTLAGVGSLVIAVAWYIIKSFLK